MPISPSALRDAVLRAMRIRADLPVPGNRCVAADQACCAKRVAALGFRVSRHHPGPLSLLLLPARLPLRPVGIPIPTGTLQPGTPVPLLMKTSAMAEKGTDRPAMTTAARRPWTAPRVEELPRRTKP